MSVIVEDNSFGGKLSWLHTCLSLLSFFFWYPLCSNKSYGSHKNRAFKDESHKGSMDSLDGEEKKDASKEDLEQEEGKKLKCSKKIY